jgi:hypothetical protein
MAVTSNIKININTQSAIKSIADLDNELGGTVSTVSDLRMAVESLTEELESTQVGSERFNELKAALIDTTTQLKNYELGIEALDHEQVASEIGSVVGGITDMVGGLTLLGVSNENVEKIAQTFAKVEGAGRAVVGTIEAYQSAQKLANTFSSMGAKLQTSLAAATTLQSTATVRGVIASKAATVAQRLLNLVMSANPVLLLVAGIAALTTAMFAFGDSNEEATQTQDDLNKIMDENNKKVEDAINLQKQLNALRTGGTVDQENQIKLMKAFGATEEQIFEAEKQLLLDRIKLLEDVSFTRGKLTAAEEEERKNLYTELQLLQTNFNNWEKQEAIKQSEKIRVENKKRQDDRLKLQEEYNKKLSTFFDAVESDRQRRITDEREKELQEAANRYDDLTALADAAGQDTTAITEQYRKDIQNINLKYDDLARKSEEEKVNERRTTNAALKVLDVELKIQEELNTASTEEEKKKIRQKYANQLRDAKIAEIKALSSIELANTKLTEEQREKIISDNNLKIAQLNCEAVDSMAEDTKKTIQDTLNEISQITSQVFGGINSLLGALSESMRLQQEQLAYERDLQYQSEEAALQNLLAQNLISREEYDAKTAEMNQQKEMEERAARRKAFNDEKKLRMASAGMAMAQAILNGLATQPLVPLGIIMAALAAVTGGIQLSNIKNQQFTAARGGVVPGSGPSHIDSVPSMLAPGEMVINSQSASMFPQTLSQINQMGGGIALTPDIPQKTTSGGNQKVYQENKEAQRVYVLETDITRSQKRVTRIEDIASF